MSGIHWAALAFAVGALIPVSADAQQYRCTEGGRVVLSDRPCAGSPSGKLGVIGPTVSEPRYSGNMQHFIVPASKAAEHTSFLGSQCASLIEAIRTAPARGVKGTVVSELQAEYYKKCAEEDRQARQRLSEQQQSERDKQRSVLESRGAERSAQQRSKEACTSMLDAIQGRRKRLNPKDQAEVDSLAGLERRFDAECVRR